MIKTDNTLKGNIIRSFIPILLIITLLALTSCAAGPNELAKTGNSEEKTAGFFQGFWHGFIALFTFIISLFNKNVNIYEVHNDGGWYNFGFILGVMIFFSGSGGAGRAAYKKNRG